jgi:hypothetical protein
MNKIRFIILGVIIAVTTSWSFKDILDELQLKFNNYFTKFPNVKVGLALNQPEYSPGDTIYFSAWYVSDTMEPVKGNHIIKVDLISETGALSQSIRFRIQNGRGYNQILLSNDLPNGVYKVVAYTDWMKNFSEDYFYQSDIKVSSKQEIIKQPMAKEEVKFFPEGGHLINGVLTKVIARGTPKLGLTIVDDSSESIERIKLDEGGYATLNFIPASGKKYEVISEATKAKFNFSKIHSDGVGIKLDSSDHSMLHFSLPVNSKLTGSDLYAVVLSKGRIIYKERFAIGPEMVYSLKLPGNNKTSEIYQLFILDSNARELAQRIFIPGSEDTSVNVELLKAPTQNDTVSMRISVLDRDNDLIEADLSLSITQEKLFNTNSNNQLNLFDPLSAVEWINKNKELDKSNINDILITQNNSRVDWSSIWEEKVPEFNNSFQSQLRWKGTITTRDGFPIPDSTLVIGFLTKNTMGYETYTKGGNFEIPVIFDFWGDDKLFLTTRYKGASLDKNSLFKIWEDSNKIKPDWRSIESGEVSDYADYDLKRNIVLNSYRFYQNIPKPEAAKSPNYEIEEEFQGADYSVKVDDYVVFPTMEDFIKEVASFIQVRKRNNQPALRVYYRIDKSIRYYDFDPLLVIDGVMTKNSSVLFDLNPKDILYLKIINNPNKLSQLGKLGESGVVFIESKKGNLASEVNNIFPVIGLNKSVSTNYLNINSKIPDLRSTIYWNPMIKIDEASTKNIKFKASDDVGPMKIVIRGITKNGTPIYYEKIIDIDYSVRN